MNPRILEAVERARLFKSLRGDDADTIDDLQVKHADRLDGLENFPDLRILMLVGCQPLSIADIPVMRSLTSLWITDSSLKSLQGIEKFDSLHTLYLPRNYVEDLSPALGCDLVDIDIVANPTTRDSRTAVVRQLLDRGCRVSQSGEREWKIARRLKSSGIPLSCYTMGSVSRLCSPGLEQTASPEDVHPEVDLSEIEALLDEEPRLVLELFHRMH